MKKIILLLIVNALALQSHAQDAHYWTEQFGNKSMLLAGSVIGSVEDLGAVYYNPARLALQDDPTFLISAKAYEYVTLKVKDGFDKKSLNNSKFNAAPSLAAGSFGLKKLPKHKFAYAFLSRTQVDYNLGVSDIRTYEFNDGALWPGEEELRTSLNISKKLRDEWMGFTWSYALDEKWSVGISNFISQLSQENEYNLVQKAFGSQKNVGAFERYRKRNYNITSWLAKAGLNYTKGKLDVGLTITFPKVYIFGSGSSVYEESLAGYDRDRDGVQEEDDDVLLSNSTSDVAVDAKSPLSIGLGMGLQLGVHKLHLSGEWFNKMDRYNVMTPMPFMGQTPQIEVRNRVYDERKSVINFGAGVEWKLKNKLYGYTSFSTDFSYLIPSGEQITAERVVDNFDNSIFTADVFNFGFGFSLFFKKMEFTLGSVYSTGDQLIGKIVSLPDVTPTTPAEYSDLRWQRIRVLFGFSLPFYSFGD
ncbi:hypothetical protein N7E81_05605 [Reichenbachiella carrageenanivorans]|uniref:Long-chain fatty acid transport protein n=1 Tax=Reichenbachiella carrageenanivorans TaxID=2979869 RepID=A0ABY6D3U5_9BACT|nr:hypothetical protein [Reichenbachiella carrageenanivorans]UXX80574.1 hypothetical protein N7E81_05605 [Reichenbachiella carrageenanivorans]